MYRYKLLLKKLLPIILIIVFILLILQAGKIDTDMLRG